MGDRTRRLNYLGPAAMLRLDVACAAVFDAFGAPPYLVGSVLERPDYRDVDVRLIIDDARYEQMFPNTTTDPSMRHLALLINSALSDWLAHATGLPIDFQIQSQTQANEYSRRTRNPLAFHDHAIRQGERDRR